MSKDNQIYRIEEIIKGVMEIARGDYSARLELSGDDDELDALAIGFNMMADDIRNSIEDLEKSKQALQESEERFRLASRSVSDLIYEWNILTNRLDWFGDIDDMLGFEPGEFPRTRDAWFNQIHPEDRPRLKDSVESHINSVKPIYEKYRIRRKDGSWRYWVDRGVPVLDDNDRPSKWIGACADITDYKLAEQEIAEQNRLNQILLDSLPFPAMLIKRDRSVVAANNVARKYGARVGGPCWRDFKQSSFISTDVKQYINDHKQDPPIGVHCEFCLADKVLDTGQMEVELEVNAFGRIWEEYWYPISKDIILHFGIDITERKKAEEQILKDLEEKEVLVNELHHRVKNNMQIISSMLMLQAQYIKDEYDKQLFVNSRNRVRSMALIHEKLYQSNNLAQIDFHVYVNNLARNLMSCYTCFPQLQIEIEEISLDINIAIPLGLIINELISNSIKHAFEGVHKPQIIISFRVDENRNYTLKVSDNGKGLSMDVDFMNSNSLGLQLVNALRQQLNGCIDLDRSDGTAFTIKFKEIKLKTHGEVYA